MNEERIMEIHNLLEDLARDAVREICDEDEQRDPQRYHTAPECRVDAVCYVLNRMTPRYISSSRGLSYLTEELNHDPQLRVDLVRLAHEGLTRVSAVSREFYGSTVERLPEGPCFNFPTVVGRVLHGETFFPLSGVTVTLRLGGEVVSMFDNRWSNPSTIPAQTAGMYNFWPASIATDTAGETRRFEFEIALAHEGFSPLSHYITLERTSDTSVERMVSLQRDFHVPDLYLF
jgi:competence protein ComFB